MKFLWQEFKNLTDDSLIKNWKKKVKGTLRSIKKILVPIRVIFIYCDQVQLFKWYLKILQFLLSGLVSLCKLLVLLLRNRFDVSVYGSQKCFLMIQNLHINICSIIMLGKREDENGKTPANILLDTNPPRITHLTKW